MLTALFSVAGCLCGAAYNVVDRARPRTADDLSVNHDSVAIVAGAEGTSQLVTPQNRVTS